MADLSKKVKVFLTAEQRATLEQLVRQHGVGAAKQRRARILLLADEGHPEGGLCDRLIAERVGLCERQVVRIRQRFVRAGDQTLEQTLQRKPRPAVPGKLDGKAQAHLVLLACSAAPPGRDHWTLQLLCDELARLELVESVCPETVRKTLKKTSLSHGGRNAFASRRSIEPASWPIWRRSSTSTKKPTTRPIP
jgi:transposase